MCLLPYWLTKVALPAVIGFLYYISPALITLCVGSFVLQRFFVSRSNEAAFIDNLVGRLEGLQSDSIEYWTTDPSGSAEGSVRLMESKIKGGIKSLAGDLSFYTERYGERHEFNRLAAELADACSGGDFESLGRKPDFGRYILIVNSINKVRAELLRRKL